MAARWVYGQSDLQYYMNDIKRFRLLSEEEETELALRVARGDTTAVAKLVEHNLRLVISIALVFKNRGVSIEDLVSSGNLGLIRAVNKFDLSQRTRLGIYAGYWIKEAIRKEIMNNAHPVRLPAWIFALLSQWRRAQKKLQADFARPPQAVETSLVLGLNPETHICVLQARIAVADQSPLREEPDPIYFRRPSPEQAVITADAVILADELERMFKLIDSELTDTEGRVLKMRFGIPPYKKPIMRKDVASQLDLTGSKIRKIELNAMKKLRGKLE